jgi:outer membrane protein OmpA-like peptidoglycan-associated protein/opacity protein-like surface antigen
MRQHYILWCGLFWSTLLLAQPRAELNLLLGGSTYLGDLQTEDHLPAINQAGFAPGLRFGLPIHKNWQLRAGIQSANYEGTDALSDKAELRDRDFSFTGNTLETSLQLVWEPLAHRRYPDEGGYRNIVSPYLFAGAGLTVFEATTRYGELGVDGFPSRIQADIDAEESPSWVLPVGLGLRFDLSKNISLGLEYGARRTFTDQLDGVSSAGRSDTNDWYSVGGLTIAYRWVTPDYDRDGFLDDDDHCPELAGVDYTKGCPDSDGDGIEDALDRCPYQFGKASVGGCPDSDFDGVADLVDKCPDYPGDATAQGCPDSDGDGLADDNDMCPHCPAINGLSGCPDSDGDGIEDARDRCPQLAGTPEGYGCPYLDADQDGVPDEEDACPNLRGLANNSGCPDADGDGITDTVDKCPDLPGVLKNGGCPEVTEEIKTTLAFVTEAVQFATGSDQLKESSLEKLNELVDLLTKYDYYHLSIGGHTDSQGKNSSNLRLSKTRAKACYDYLIDRGVDPTRMMYDGFGESQPVASNKTAAGRKKNRRVAFELFVP